MQNAILNEQIVSLDKDVEQPLVISKKTNIIIELLNRLIEIYESIAKLIFFGY